jgi:uncharacterized membrane protein YbaN (DUF454 family)
MRWVMFTVGSIAIMVAAIALWIPVVPSSPFWLTGGALLAASSDRVRRVLNRLERKLPPRHRWKIRRLASKIKVKPIRDALQLPGDEALQR